MVFIQMNVKFKKQLILYSYKLKKDFYGIIGLFLFHLNVFEITINSDFIKNLPLINALLYECLAIFFVINK